MVKPLVDGFSTKRTVSTRGFTCLFTRRASTCPALPSASSPSIAAAPPCDRFSLAAPERRPSGPADTRPSARGTHVCPTRGRVGVGTTTAYRYVTEAVQLLAALAPSLTDAVRTASVKAFVILDGTYCRSTALPRRPYSGKHRKHGMNVQVITDPFGRPLWASPALPGAVHDARAAREHGIVDALAEAGIKCWADKGYRDAGGTVRIPRRGR